MLLVVHWVLPSIQKLNIELFVYISTKIAIPEVAYFAKIARNITAAMLVSLILGN
jgi:hypothetical protein